MVFNATFNKFQLYRGGEKNETSLYRYSDLL